MATHDYSIANGSVITYNVLPRSRNHGTHSRSPKLLYYYTQCSFFHKHDLSLLLILYIILLYSSFVVSGNVIDVIS